MLKIQSETYVKIGIFLLFILFSAIAIVLLAKQSYGLFLLTVSTTVLFFSILWAAWCITAYNRHRSNFDKEYEEITKVANKKHKELTVILHEKIKEEEQ